jgi:hypothetical protein
MSLVQITIDFLLVLLPAAQLLQQLRVPVILDRTVSNQYLNFYIFMAAPAAHLVVEPQEMVLKAVPVLMAAAEGLGGGAITAFTSGAGGKGGPGLAIVTCW